MKNNLETKWFKIIKQNQVLEKCILLLHLLLKVFGAPVYNYYYCYIIVVSNTFHLYFTVKMSCTSIMQIMQADILKCKRGKEKSLILPHIRHVTDEINPLI